MSHREDLIEQLVSTDISRSFAEKLLDLAIGEAEERALQAEKRIEELEALLEYERGLNASLRDVMKDEERASRQAFIRQAAIAIYVQGMMVPDKAHGVVTFQPSTCWRAAAELWAAKPEDCLLR